MKHRTLERRIDFVFPPIAFYRVESRAGRLHLSVPGLCVPGRHMEAIGGRLRGAHRGLTLAMMVRDALEMLRDQVGT